jgi:hypothetical protein
VVISRSHSAILANIRMLCDPNRSLAPERNVEQLHALTNRIDGQIVIDRRAHKHNSRIARASIITANERVNEPQRDIRRRSVRRIYPQCPPAKPFYGSGANPRILI